VTEKGYREKERQREGRRDIKKDREKGGKT
jgi:hypothetical protein